MPVTWCSWVLEAEGGSGPRFEVNRAAKRKAARAARRKPTRR